MTYNLSDIFALIETPGLQDIEGHATKGFLGKIFKSLKKIFGGNVLRRTYLQTFSGKAQCIVNKEVGAALVSGIFTPYVINDRKQLITLTNLFIMLKARLIALNGHRCEDVSVCL